MGGEAAYPRAVGPDRLLKVGERLILISKVDMPLLRPRKYRRTAVMVDGSTYCVTRREGGEGRDHRYVMEPWPTRTTDLPGATLVYDSEFVASRDALARSESRLILAHSLILPLMPLAGLLPSHVRILLENKLGIPARKSAFLSILLELAVFFVLGTLGWVVTYSAMRAGAPVEIRGFAEPMKLYVAVSLLLVDTFVRYGSYVRGDRSPYGVGEWVLGRPPAGGRQP